MKKYATEADAGSVRNKNIGANVRTGDTAHLQRGQEVPIELSDDKPLDKIVVGVGWDPVRGGVSMDIDSAVVVAGDGEYETVYFGNLDHPSGCVEHHGDNLTGEDKSDDGDDENIVVYFKKVPPTRDRLIFVLDIYNSYERGQTLRDVRNMYVVLYDPRNNRPLMDFRADAADEYDTAIVLGAAYRRGDDWTFKAIGKSCCAVDMGDLAKYVCNKY
ncbi:MAG: TerD family protein [Clostridia bacterium]|nr:TerD family protein [Clostridia bacterium]